MVRPRSAEPGAFLGQQPGNLIDPLEVTVAQTVEPGLDLRLELEIEQTHRAGHLDSNLIPSAITTHIVSTAEPSAVTESDDAGRFSVTGMANVLVEFLTTTLINEYDAAA